MIKHMKKQYLYSLRVRYAGIAILFALIILTSASLAYHSLKTVRHSTTSSFETRHQLQQRTRYIRDAIWRAHESLQMFLFNPQKDLYQEQIHGSLNQAIESANLLLQRYKNLGMPERERVAQLKELLYKLDNSVSRLIRIRTTATEQYPSLAFARGTMLGLNNSFVTAATLAIEEYTTETGQASAKEIFQALIQARHHWNLIISNFRMYLANRLGTFDNTVFESQIYDIETQFSGLENVLEKLKQYDDRDQLDLQASSSLTTMLETSSKWYADYLTVKKIHEGDNWRKDAQLIKNEVEPMLEDIWAKMLDIELGIERNTEHNVSQLTRIAQYHVNALWLAAGLAILFVVTSYLLLDKSILQPLSDLTRAIKAEAHGTNTNKLPKVNTLETQGLLDAFTEMRNQIHHRQTALEHQALHDSLTGLANRTLLLDRLRQGIQHCDRHKSALSLLVIDLDNFKEVNDTLGHQVGDKLLEEVGRRLTQTLREMDTVARLGGDEFAILLPEDNEFDAAEVARKIQHMLDDEFLINNLQLYVRASIGIASYPEHAKDIQDLIKYADIAMYTAKHNKLGYAIFDSKQATHSISQLSLGSELRNALEDGSMHIVYQPKLSCQSQQIVGLEALLRWTHPSLGPIPASETIELAEQTGFINQLTIWITDQVARQQKQWLNQGKTFSISINLSVYCLQSHAVIEQILSRLSSSSIPAEQFMFEITESAMMIEPQHAIDTLKQISKLGASVSIDDFGTGFSSLAYLKKMPVDELKIDKSFVNDMLENDNDAIIVRSIVDLAHNLGLKVVAEGVENSSTLQLLEILNCDVVQGNYICAPMSAERFDHWYSEYESSESILEPLA